MAAKRLGFKPTLRQARLASNSAQSYYAAMMPLDDPRRAEAVERLAQEREAIGTPRKQAQRRDLEGPVVAVISELLARHPRVIWAARFNSGMASYEAKSGRYAPVWFHKFLRVPSGTKMRMPDFFGLYNQDELQPWRISALIFPIAIEAKAPGWTKPRDDREREQEAFLAMVRQCGGIGIFASSAEAVAEALK